MQAYNDTLIEQFDDPVTGNAAAGALVHVFLTGTTTPAAIFDLDEVSIGNPLTTDSKGNYAFKVGDGTYDIVGKFNTPNETRRDNFQIFEFATQALTRLNPDTLAIWQDDVSAVVNDVITTKERSTGNSGGAEGNVIAGTGTANGRDIVAHGTLSLSWVLRKNAPMTPMMYGYDLDVTNMTSVALVDANWDIMKFFIADVKTNDLVTPDYKTIWTTNALSAEWVSGRAAPIGFYSDSTTDGSTTTGHVPSTGLDSPFGVTVTESPNAYPARLQSMLKGANFDTTIPVRCYNGGFDGQSFLNGFGLKHWYNTWFRGLSGSNIDFSDVKMIVQGFGTSDSINLNDTATVIDDYERDLECVIIDSFLRGVQPAMQTPPMTVENSGNLVAGRKGWQTVEIIQAVQQKLVDKYDLQYFSYSEAWRTIFSNFTGTKYRDLMSPDTVHPNDEGHSIHASYLSKLFNKNIETLEAGEGVNSLFAGHPAYQPDHADNIAPASSGGDILKFVTNLGGISDESFIYSWLAAEGNGKAASAHLVRATVYVDKPTALLMKDVESNRTAKDILVQSYYLGSNSTPTPAWQLNPQPTDEFFSHKSFMTLLPPGLNTITIKASSDSTDQTFGGLYLVDLEKMNFNFERGTNLAKYLKWPDVLNAYTPQARISKNRADYYNPQDQAFYSLSFDISTAVVFGTPVFVRTHYNDVSANNDSYNIFEFSGDNFILKVVDDGAVAVTVTTLATPGLNALLASGAHVEIKMRSRFSTPNGLNVQIFVDGIVRNSFTAAVGEMWTDGYGFDTDIFCKNISMVVSTAQTGFADLDKLI